MPVKLNKYYTQINASQSAATLGSAGALGDHLDTIIIIPLTASPGAVSLQDGTQTAVTLFAGSGLLGSLADPIPVQLKLDVVSQYGAWKVTTGSNVAVLAIGEFGWTLP